MFTPSTTPSTNLPPIIVYGEPGTGRPGLAQPAVTIPVDFPVENTSNQLGLRTIIQTMVDVLDSTGSGMGLAAPQVGLHILTTPPPAGIPPLSLMLRVFILKTNQVQNGKTVYQEFINPVMSFPSNYSQPGHYEAQWDLAVCNEGCLSFPDTGLASVYPSVFRPASVTLEYSTLDNFPNGPRTVQTFTNSDNTFGVVQHEMDHLNGKLYFNYFGDTGFESFIPVLKKLSAGDFDNPGYKTFPSGN